MGVGHLEEESHHSEALFCTLVNQMHLHRKMAPINCVLGALYSELKKYENYKPRSFTEKFLFRLKYLNIV